ncbi:Sporulation protein YhaL [Evansella caseinilytica]|uniref:Sporulation protein YhaL n=1 Tax=Evansella caseinilytica TaxID=1503961 RepID=A0A1H3K0U5_9BACI|nr:sporulation YhaL family protein [Evansella caseinilytica]SDY45803.1 Sporulation protein YhaL [Evansella caseinilytica]
MNPIAVIFSLLGALFLAFVIRLLSLTSVGTGLATAPWWVYAVYLAIVFSGMMFVYTWSEERRKEREQIEEEGSRIISEYRQRRLNNQG